MISIGTYQSPLGPLTVAGRDGTVLAVAFDDTVEEVAARLERALPGISFTNRVDPAVEDALAAYFAGRLDALDPLPVDPAGTPFQRHVWTALRRIPPGTTCSYKALAAAIDLPDAVRAVGAANGANPIAIVIPCHRVIGSSGRLVGYGGGLDRKRWLLAHEGVLARSLPLDR